jgi:hypothetical protein
MLSPAGVRIELNLILAFNKVQLLERPAPQKTSGGTSQIW